MNHSKIKICALTVSMLVCMPALVKAQQISPNPNPLDSTIIIDGNAENSVDFANVGVISINDSGILGNSGNLINGVWSLDASGTEGYHGSLINAGSIVNAPGSSLINYGYLSSSGIMNNSGILSSGTVGNYAGYLGNTGTLNNLADGTLTTFAYLGNLAGGYLNNYGALNIGTPDDHAGSLNNFGDLTNFGSLNYSGNLYSTGNFINQGSLATYDIFGSLVNEGSMFNQGSLITGGLLENIGSLTNSGTLINTGSVVGNGFYTQTIGQTVVNGWFNQTSSQILEGDLSGAGIIAGELIIDAGANVKPGNSSTDTLTVNGDFNSGGNLFFEIAGLGEFDVLDINGDALFSGGTIEFQFIDGFHAAANNYWDFFFSDTISGRDNINFVLNGLDSGLSWSVIHIGNQGERLLITAIPEPETYLMLLAGLGLIGYTARRRRKNAVYA